MEFKEWKEFMLNNKSKTEKTINSIQEIEQNNEYERFEPKFFENVDINDDVFSFQETVYKAIVKQDDEHTKQVIKDYVRQKYPKENVRIDFLDEEIVDNIIELGIQEYLRRYY